MSIIALGILKCVRISKPDGSAQHVPNESSRSIWTMRLLAGRGVKRGTRNKSLPSTVHLCTSTQPRDRRGKAVCHSELRTRPMSWIAVSRSLSVRVGLFRYQPFPHVSGKAKLFGFSDGFGSLRSGRQLSCLRQSLRCPGSPIVTIEIVARQFCHVIVLTVALAGGCLPNRQRRTSSGRR